MTQGTLQALAERAFKWSALTTVGRFGLQLVAQILLARLLGPDNYGVYGIGMVVLTFAGFLSGNAFSYILMLKKDVDREDVRFAFTWQLMAGTLCAVGMYFGAAPLADFFTDPRVEPMVQWMALACLLGAMAGPATCLLQRDLNFRALGLIGLAAYGAGYLLVGVPMALSGQGAMSLAAAAVVQSAIALVAVFAVRPHSLKPLLRHQAAGADTLATGRTVFVTNITNWLLGNIDRAIIGRLLNTQAVGLYSVAYNIASIPNALLLNAMQPAFLAAGARLQDNRAALGSAWKTVLACVMVLLAPVATVMALLSGDLVLVLYGSAWSEAGWVMAILFLCVPAWAALGLSTPVLWNTNRKHLEALLQLPVLALALAAWWSFAPSGIRAVALVSAAVVYLRAAVIVVAGLRAVHLRPSALLPLAGRGLFLVALSAVAVEAGRMAATSLDAPLATLVCGGAAAATVLLALVAVFPQVLGHEARGVLSRFIPSVGPGWVRTAPEARP